MPPTVEYDAVVLDAVIDKAAGVAVAVGACAAEAGARGPRVTTEGWET